MEDKRFKMLDDQPPLSNKMKFFLAENGSWLLRVRQNRCHTFHGSDRINFGIRKADEGDLVLRIYLRVQGKPNAPVKSCPNHATKFKNKVTKNPFYYETIYYYRVSGPSSFSTKKMVLKMIAPWSKMIEATRCTSSKSTTNTSIRW